MPSHHITSDARVRALYERLAVLGAVEAVKLRNPRNARVFEVTASELMDSQSMSLSVLRDHLERLQYDGLAVFLWTHYNQFSPGDSALKIGDPNTRVLAKLRREAQRDLDRVLGRSASRTRVSQFRSWTGQLIGHWWKIAVIISAGIGTLGAAVVHISTFWHWMQHYL
jgi:hypothetical protein